MAKKDKMEWYDHAGYWLVTVGALNTGLGVFNMNPIAAVFKTVTPWVYGLIGVAGVYSIATYFKLIK